MTRKQSFLVWIALVLLVCVSLFLPQSCSKYPSGRVEKIFLNGHVLTMDEDMPEVEAMAVREGKFLDTGDSAKMRQKYPDADVFDLEGKTVMPGIIESHGHLLSLGQSFLELNLEGIPSPEDVVQKVRDRVKATLPEEWIIGWGWDEGAWARNYPDNKELSDVSPHNPVYLRGLHGFACWANEKALGIAGINKDTPDPPNGVILKDPETGHPTGILTNSAQALLNEHIPPLKSHQIEKALSLAIEECLKFGLTTIHEARTSSPMLQAFRSLKLKGKLNGRIYVMLDWTDEKLLEFFFSKGPDIDPDNLLTVRCIKIFVDGALGSRGAALMDPYSDAPGEQGLVVTPEEEVIRLTSEALKSGFQVAVHAIGDKANSITLNAYRKAIAAVPKTSDHRLRLEHAQVVALEDIPQFAPLGVVLSMQPPHCTSDMEWAEERVGPERIKGAYAWRSFLDSGVHLTLNSDFPGESLDPFFGMYCAMTRQTPEGSPEGGWYPDQCMSRDEVLKAYTGEAAYSGFEEEFKGKIHPGYLADFIILSDDILTIPVSAFLSLRVEKTYLGGKLVYARQE